MKKIFIMSVFVLLLSGCGTKQLDDTNTSTGVIQTGDDAYAGAEVEQFATGSDTVFVATSGDTNTGTQTSGQIVTDMKPSRISDNGCVWKKYSNFGVTFLGEDCELDGRSLKIETIESKKVFAIKQDDYDIDPENMEDTLGIQVIDTNGATIADSIKKIAGASCDIQKVSGKNIGSFDIYTIKDSSDTGDGTCSGYADLDGSANKIFLIDNSNSSKFVFMNLTNQQNTIDLNNFKLD